MNNVVEKKYGIVNASFNVGEISDKILKESKRDNKFRESVSFFKNCPYFITNKCKSIKPIVSGTFSILLEANCKNVCESENDEKNCF